MARTDITISEPTGPEFEHVQSMGAPEPGTYWKAIEPIKGEWSERLKINDVPAGEALLLLEVVEADGAPHSYVLAAHPRHGKNASNQRVHVDDFHQIFEPAEDGQALRAAEIQRLQAQIASTQKAMLSPPPDDPASPRAQLEHDPQPSGGSALVTRDQVKAMAEYVASLQHRAEVQAKWIEKQAAKLSEETSMLACFYSETAQVQLARAKAQLAGVAGILKTVENLRLYTGDEVEILQLREGESAEPGEPLTIYQEVLAFDEEAAILVEQGGLDHTKVEEVVQAMSDIRLLDRMIPAPRGVAMVRFRSTFKEFAKGEDIGTLMYNRHMNRVSQTNRLLVRDGEQAYLVSAESTFEGLTQLLTSTGEQTAYFKDGEVRHEHLHYAKARASQLSNLEKNAKALIVLWGLRDRAEILGTWAAPMGASWLDAAFQNDWMRLLSSDGLIGVKRPSYAEWRDAQNATIAPGSWVAVTSEAIETPDNVKVASYVSITQVYIEKGLLKIKVPVAPRYSWQETPRTKQCVVELSKTFLKHGGHLCLDRVSADDLRYYLTSRSQRRSYGDYIPLFREAAAWVEDRDKAEAWVRDFVSKAAGDAGIASEGEGMSRALTEAIAAARLSMRGAKIPDRAAPSFKTFLKAALDILYVKLRGADDVAAAAEAHFGERLAKVVMDREGYKAYVVPADDEIDRRIPSRGVFSAVRFRTTTDGIEPTSTAQLTSLTPKRGEEIVRQWTDRCTAWKHRTMPEDFQKTFDQIHDASERAAELLKPAFAEDLIKRQDRQLLCNRSKFVTRMLVGVPIGTITWADDDYRSAAVLYAVADALLLAASLGGPEMRKKSRDMISKWYGNPEAQLRRFDESVTKNPWTLEAFWVPTLPAELEPVTYWESAKESGFSLQLSEQKRQRFAVSSASALGVKLIPELLQLLQAPTKART